MPLKHNLLKLVFPALLMSVSVSTHADRLTIPGHYENNQRIAMPHRGSSMDQVLAQFGEPIRRFDAVGEPPITTWDYGDFRVFFEYQIVLHALDLTTLIMPQ